MRRRSWTTPPRLAAAAAVALALAFAPAGLGAAEEGEIEEIEEIEVIEEVEVAAVEPAGGQADAGPGLVELLGRLHPMVVHMPIAWLVLLLLTDIVGLGLGRERFRAVGVWLAGLTVLSFVPAVVSGLVRLGYQPYADVAEGPVFTHRNLMLVVVGLTVLALALRLARRNALAGALKWAYLALVAAAVAVVGYAGHIGGELVYGENYLPF